MRTHWFQSLFLALLCLCGLQAVAAEEPRIDDLSPIDRQYMAQQRELVSNLTSRHFGRQFNGDKANDIPLLQRLLDERIVRNDQTRELQAMGVILGDVLAADLGMHWVAYEDSKGRSRALRYRETDNYLFPVTMISRRREVDNRTPVAEIYAKAEAAIREVIPPLPFQ